MDRFVVHLLGIIADLLFAILFLMWADRLQGTLASLCQTIALVNTIAAGFGVVIFTIVRWRK